jgi:hypothetical protein
MTTAKAQYLVEMTVYDPALGAERLLYFSTRGYTSPPDGSPANQHYAPRILQPGNYTGNMFQSGKTAGESQVGYGEVRLNNPDGALDHLLDYGFDGRPIVFKTITALGVLVLLASCSMEQPEFTNQDITVRIKDPQAIFSGALQPVKYAGSNILPNGIEGTDDIKGKPKPLTFGTAYNVTPVLVNTSKLIYQVNTGLTSVPAVYDKGVALQQGGDYGSLAEMEAAAPDPAQYRVWPAGGCFRLGSSPAGQITADAIEGATAADRTAAQIAKRIASRVIPASSISAEDVSDLDTANGSELGIYVGDETTVLAVLDQLLGSVGAWYAFDTDMTLRMQQFSQPQGDPDVTLDAGKYLTLERVASQDVGRGIPPYKVNLNYQRNFTVQTSDLAGSVLAQPWIVQDYAFPGDAIVGWMISAYGNGLFVALQANGSTAAISADGVSWREATLPVTASWSSITYGGGRFVAVAEAFDGGGSNVVITSVDGVNWTLGALPSTAIWMAVCYGNGKFVAVAYSSTFAAVSSDGITWTSSTLPANTGWASLAFGNGTFVAAVSNGIVATSADGVSWVQRTAPIIGASKNHLAYGAGLFVMLGVTNQAATSPDGITWALRAVPSANQWGPVVYGDSRFYALGNTVAIDTASGFKGLAIYSYDGCTWFQQPSVVSDNLCYGNGQYVSFVAQDGAYRAATYSLTTPSPRAIWLSKDYRTVSSSAVAVQAAHLLAPELNVDTLLLSSAAARAEADRLLALYSAARRDTLQVTVRASVLSAIELGKVVQVVSPRYGYQSGKLFRVIGVTRDWGSGIVTLTLWG